MHPTKHESKQTNRSTAHLSQLGEIIVLLTDIRNTLVCRKPKKGKSQPVTDSVALRKKEDTARAIHEINRRHRSGEGSYPKIIKAMMSDPVWGARMRHMSASTWRIRAIENKGR